MEPKDSLRKELDELSPFLSKLKKEEEGFTVPENYFKTLPDNILSQINKKEEVVHQPSTSRSIWEELIESLQILLQPRPALAFASVAVLIVAGYFLMNNQTSINESTYANVQIEDISMEELSAYLSENIEEVDELLLISEDLVPGNGDLEQEQELDDYLDELIEDTDIQDLEELL